MSVQTLAGARIYIGPAAASTVDTQSEFEALAWTEIGEVENFGEFGDKVGMQSFTAVKDRRVRKFKTTYDAGEMNLVVGFDGGDAGQDALVAAFASDSDFAFKIELNDEPDNSPANPTTFYFRAKVMGKAVNLGAVDNVVRRSFPIAINSAIIEVSAAAS